MGLYLLPVPVAASVVAGKAFASYLKKARAEGVERVSRMPLPDFFIGTHASVERLKLATRDPARVKTYFPDVEMILPENPSVQPST